MLTQMDSHPYCLCFTQYLFNILLTPLLRNLSSGSGIMGRFYMKILVVDSSLTMRRILKKILNQLGHGEIIEAENDELNPDHLVLLYYI